MQLLLFPPRQGIIFRASTTTTAPNIGAYKADQAPAAQGLPSCLERREKIWRSLTTYIFGFGENRSLGLLCLATLIVCAAAHAELPAPTLRSPFVAVDINVGEVQIVTLPNGKN